MECDEPLIIKWKNYLSKKFKINGDNFEFSQIFNLICAYQYYDIPYDMHFFLPENIDNENGHIENILVSCLVISLESDSQIDKFKNNFIKLEKLLHRIVGLERLIWEKTSEHLILKNNWEKEYKKRFEKYERLCKIGESISEAIINKLNIELEEELKISPHLITSRVKKFESFYNKIIKRANGHDNDFPSKFDLKKLFNIDSNGEKICNDSKQEYLNKFKDLVLHPNRMNCDLIFKSLKDITGVRIICKYEYQVSRIMKILDDIQEFDLLKADGKKVYDHSTILHDEDTLYYRSIHFTFYLGHSRLQFIEFEDLKDLIFEIQVRTTLSQGWTDLSHDIYYKPNIPESKAVNYRSKIRKNLNRKADALLEIDESFNELIEKYKSTLNEGI